jgi:hypothetical protein
LWNSGEGEVQMAGQEFFTTRPWNEADDERLRSLALRRMDARLIGMQMNRAPASVRMRAGQLQILLRRPDAQKQMG